MNNRYYVKANSYFLSKPSLPSGVSAGFVQKKCLSINLPSDVLQQSIMKGDLVNTKNLFKEYC
jgi:hypothetical protein